MWRKTATLPKRVHAAPLVALRYRGRRNGRVGSLPICSAMHQAPSEAVCGLQSWCRPLSGRASTTASGDSHNDSVSFMPPAVAAAAVAELPAMVALGKFDALHKGHRGLAAAAAQLGGAPWLVSFSGIAEVLGWPARLPLVAPCDRRRVLAMWGQYCKGHVPRECSIPFAEVRGMSPEAFVELLAVELQVAGVVVGSNYRFGYRAAGTAELLQQLGPQHGLQVRVLGLVGSPASTAAAPAPVGPAVAAGAATAAGQQQQQPPPQEQQSTVRQQAHQAVSSSRVRHALSAGDVADAAECLGRPYRLVTSLAGVATSALPDGAALRLPAAALLNQPPCPGRYDVLASLAGGETLHQVLAPQRALLGVDEAGLSLHGGGNLLGQPSVQHLVLDFL